MPRRPTANQEIYHGIGIANWSTIMVIVRHGPVSTNAVFEAFVQTTTEPCEILYIILFAKSFK